MTENTDWKVGDRAEYVQPLPGASDGPLIKLGGVYTVQGLTTSDLRLCGDKESRAKSRFRRIHTERQANFGDTIRTLTDKAFSSDVPKGTVYKVVSRCGQDRIRVEQGKNDRMAWYFRPQDYEIIAKASPAKTESTLSTAPQFLLNEPVKLIAQACVGDTVLAAGTPFRVTGDSCDSGKLGVRDAADASRYLPAKWFVSTSTDKVRYKVGDWVRHDNDAFEGKPVRINKVYFRPLGLYPCLTFDGQGGEWNAARFLPCEALATEKHQFEHPLPEGYERELLTMLAEECAEVTQRVTKALRFGMGEVQPGQDLNNAQRISQEVGDAMASMRRLYEIGSLNKDDVIRARYKKLGSMAKFMKHQVPE